jgi:hypothetical protein
MHDYAMLLMSMQTVPDDSHKAEIPHLPAAWVGTWIVTETLGHLWAATRAAARPRA